MGWVGFGLEVISYMDNKWVNEFYIPNPIALPKPRLEVISYMDNKWVNEFYIPNPIALPKPTHLTPLVLGMNHHLTWFDWMNGLRICCQLNGQSNPSFSGCWLGGVECRVTRSRLQSIVIVSKKKKIQPFFNHL